MVSTSVLHPSRIGAALVVTSLALLPLASPPDEPETLGLTTYLRELVTVAAEVGGREVKLLLDTGGGLTVLGPDVIESIDGEVTGRNVGFRMNGDRLDLPLCHDVELGLGSRTVHLEQVGVWDVMGLLPEGLPRLDGVLALDALEGIPFTLDLARRKLVLESEESLAERIRSAKRLEVRVATGLSGAERTLFVLGRVDGMPHQWLLFDSGNIDRLTIGTHVAEVVAAEAFEESRVAGMLDVSLTLEGLAPVDRRARVQEILYDGALSTQEIGQWKVTVDLARGAVWVASE